jgi:hypothetical protein
MVMDMARALVYVASLLRGVPRDEPVAHGDLEHAHWDPAGRRWLTHADHSEETSARAA